jgi:hypothetical protein
MEGLLAAGSLMVRLPVRENREGRMAETFYRAIEIGGCGFIHETGDAVIAAPLSDDDELHFAFPADDIPQLMLLLSRVYAQNITGADARGSLGFVNLVDNAQFRLGSDGQSIGLFADLSSGVPVSLGFSREIAEGLRNQLNEILA